MNLGQKVSLARIKKGLNRDELAQKVGVSYSMISHIESNRKQPGRDTLIKIAAVLDVSLEDYLLSDGIITEEELERQQCMKAIFENSAFANYVRPIKKAIEYSNSPEEVLEALEIYNSVKNKILSQQETVKKD